jgi:putative heme transporter
VVGVVVVVLIYDQLAGHRVDLRGIDYVWDHLAWWWLPAAFVFEAASFVAFAGVQGKLLGAAGVATPSRTLIGLTLSAQAIADSLPAGPAVAAIYMFRWYRRLGAEDAIAIWALVGTAVTGFLSLALVASAGLVLSFGVGVSYDLIPVVFVVLALTVTAGILFVYERPLARVAEWALRTCHRLTGRPRGDLEEHLVSIVERVTVVRLKWRQALSILAWGLSNWLCDCTCLALCFLAVGADVPWRALLLAYGAGMLAANLPITPGGLGAVTASITAALEALTGFRPTTIYAILLYRLFSFWGVLVVGWLSCAWGAHEVRRGMWSRRVLQPDGAVLSGGPGALAAGAPAAAGSRR